MKNKTELNKILQEVLIVAEDAGTKLDRRQKKLSKLTVSYKEAQGVVSEADVEAENFIIKKLQKIVPEAEFLAEESAFIDDEIDIYDKAYFSKKEYVWCIDPLDGTTNFLNGMDYYSVCIALLYKGHPILSVVHWPKKKLSYCALKERGAWKVEDGRRKRLVHLCRKSRTKDSVLVTGFAAEKGILRDREFELFKSMMGISRGVRRMGSAALDLCLVSEGIFDGFWERGLSPWDVSASALICKEVGLRVTDYNGKDFHPFQKTIMCFPEQLYRDYKRHITAFFKNHESKVGQKG